MSSAIVSTDAKTRLVAAIRAYVHMDNLAETHARQAANARAARAKAEVDAIALMKEMGLSGSTIQVSGASLQITKKKSSSGLTWGYLEREVPAWATRSGLSASQSAGLMTWLQAHRETKEVEMLRKVGAKPSPADETT
jgi:hypothetical protein